MLVACILLLSEEYKSFNSLWTIGLKSLFDPLLDQSLSFRRQEDCLETRIVLILLSGQ
jgi:hypothetical protein